MFISNQAKTALFMQITQIIAVIIVLLVSPATATAKAIGFFTALFFMGIGAYVTFYSINCMVVGQCNMFAWIVVGIMLVFFVFSVLATLFGMSAFKKANDQLNSAAQYSGAFVPQFPVTPSVSVVTAPAPVVPAVAPAATPAAPTTTQPAK
jgi:hypothetical protein